MLHVLIELSLIYKVLVGGNKLANPMKAIILEIALIIATIKLPEHPLTIGHIIFPLAVIKRAIRPYLPAFTLPLSLNNFPIILNAALKRNLYLIRIGLKIRYLLM